MTTDAELPTTVAGDGVSVGNVGHCSFSLLLTYCILRLLLSVHCFYYHYYLSCYIALICFLYKLLSLYHHFRVAKKVRTLSSIVSLRLTDCYDHH